MTASGTGPLAFQWLHAGTNLPNATNVVLTLTNAQATHGGAYQVLVTNIAGSKSSVVVNLTVLPAPITNTPPIVASIPNYTVVEGNLLTFTNSATDVDVPAQTLTFSLVGAPAGAIIHPTSGVFTWTPTEAQGPGSYNLTVRVSDDGTPSLAATQAIVVPVLESNSPPIIGSVPSQTVYQGENVVIPMDAVDTDIPANALSFNLLTAPTNAYLTNGIFIWRPTLSQADATHTISIGVTDNGVPPMNATQSFQLTVNRLAQLGLQSLQPGRATIGVIGRQGATYFFEGSSNLLTWEVLGTTNATSSTVQFVDTNANGSQRYYRIREQRQ